MPTVVIIHAPDDAMPARALAEKLRQTRVTVTLDKPLGEETRAAVKSAQAAIVLWSPRSVSQQALADDVEFARGKPGVIHACMQNTQAPERFRSDRTVNLTGWRGEDEFPAWRELAQLVTDKVGLAPLPPPPPRSGSGFFQPGRPSDAGPPPRPMPQPRQRAPASSAPRSAPQPSRPAPVASAPPRPAQRAPLHAVPDDPPPRKGGGGLVIALVALVAVAAAGGGGYYFWTQSQNARTTSAAWESVEQNNAASLRAFIAGDPGEYRDEAETALAELEERTFEAASDSDTVEALEAFLNDFPDSEHALVVRGRIAELRSQSQPPEVATLPADGATTDPDLVPPGSAPAGPAQLTPPPAPAPTPAPAATQPAPSDLPVN